jgi:hypothetical protein
MNQRSEFKKHLKLVDNLSDNEFADALEFEVIQAASLSLLKRWFPKKVPTDIEKWAEIAYEDVLSVIQGLHDEGYVIIKNDERTDK